MLVIAELSRAAPLRRQIVAAIVQHLVCLDVEIRWQDIAFSLGKLLQLKFEILRLNLLTFDPRGA